MVDYSPATRAIWAAFNDAPTCAEVKLAAAFRALAMRINGADVIKQDVLDIAAELDITQSLSESD